MHDSGGRLNLVSRLRPGQMGSLVTDALFWLGRIFYILGFSPVESEQKRPKRIPQGREGFRGVNDNSSPFAKGKA